MYKVILNYITNAFSIIAITGSIISFVLLFKPALKGNALLPTAFISLLCIILYTQYSIKKAQWGREIKYGQILTFLTDGFSEIHCLNRKTKSNENRLKAINEVCHYTSKAFSIITGTNCSVSIKAFIRSEKFWKFQQYTTSNNTV